MHVYSCYVWPCASAMLLLTYICSLTGRNFLQQQDCCFFSSAVISITAWISFCCEGPSESSWQKAQLNFVYQQIMFTFFTHLSAFPRVWLSDYSFTSLPLSNAVKFNDDIIVHLPFNTSHQREQLNKTTQWKANTFDCCCFTPSYGQWVVMTSFVEFRKQKRYGHSSFWVYTFYLML